MRRVERISIKQRLGLSTASRSAAALHDSPWRPALAFHTVMRDAYSISMTCLHLQIRTVSRPNRTKRRFWYSGPQISMISGPTARGEVGGSDPGRRQAIQPGSGLHHTLP